MMKKLLMILILSMPFGMSAMKRAHDDENGASAVDTTWRGPAGATKLHMACLKGQTATAQALMAIDPNLITVCASNGYTPLHAACFGGHIATAQALLISGSGIEVQDRRRTTALMYASMGGHPGVVALLLRNGADVHAIDSEGKTALDLAFNDATHALLREAMQG